MKRALIVLTSHDQLGNTGKATGWYLPEVSHVLWPLVDAGFEVDFASPKGGAAPMDPGSRNTADPDNRRMLENAAMMSKVAQTMRPEEVDASRYELVFFAGGHGTMWDLRGSKGLQALTAAIYERGGIVSAVCHGPAALVDVQLSTGRYLVDGKEVGGFTDDEEAAVELVGVVPFLLERDLRARGAHFVAGPRWSDTVVVFERLVTGQNPQSARTLGKRLVELSASNR